MVFEECHWEIMHFNRKESNKYVKLHYPQNIIKNDKNLIIYIQY